MGNLICKADRAKVPQGHTIASQIHQIETNAVATVELEHIAEAGIRKLSAALKSNSSVQNLYITAGNLRSLETDLLCQGLRLNASIVELKLIKCDMDDISELGIYLKTNTSLAKLTITDNRKLGDMGAADIAAGLAENTTLTDLRYTYNDCGTRGAIAFARALELKNRTLVKLNLYRNCIDDQGALAFAPVIQKNDSMRMMDLSDNYLTGRSVAVLDSEIASRIAAGRKSLKMKLIVNKHPLSEVQESTGPTRKWTEQDTVIKKPAGLNGAARQLNLDLPDARPAGGGFDSESVITDEGSFFQHSASPVKTRPGRGLSSGSATPSARSLVGRAHARYSSVGGSLNGDEVPETSESER